MTPHDLPARLIAVGEYAAVARLDAIGLALAIEPPVQELLETLVAAIERRDVAVLAAEALLAAAPIQPQLTRSGAVVTGEIDEAAALVVLAKLRAARRSS